MSRLGGKRKVPLSFCILALSFKVYLYNCEADPLTYQPEEGKKFYFELSNIFKMSKEVHMGIRTIAIQVFRIHNESLNS